MTAACATADARLFDSDRHDLTAAADICATCPIRHQCLADAQARHESTGVWGGCVKSERGQWQRIPTTADLAAAAERRLRPVRSSTWRETEKSCSTCLAWLPFTAFTSDSSRPGGLAARCRRCASAAYARRRRG